MTIECPSCASPSESDAPACCSCGQALARLAVGAVLASRYQLRALLDARGMGSVYQAFDQKLEQEVAVKIFRTDLPSNAEAVRRFRADIDRLSAISHPGVGRIHDHGESGVFGYFSMELFAGPDLREVLRAEPRGLHESEGLDAVLQIASAVQALHEAGIHHGDLKPSQVLRDPQGLARIVPFGMVKDPMALSALGEFVGTPEYMSPEHCWGQPLDIRSDVYALGILAFELFTGEVPFRGQNPSETIFKQMREEPSFEEGAGARVPRRFVPALARALAKEAEDRFKTLTEFAEALDTQAPEATGEVPPGPETVSATGEGPTRRDERFAIPTDVRMRKLGADGLMEREERTIAEDLSRSGMRVLTSWSDLAAGDTVSIEELGGGFATEAVVRHVTTGPDQIPRAGLEFLENRAPDRLVGTTTGIVPPPTRVSTTVATPTPPRAVPPPVPPPRPEPRPSRSRESILEEIQTAMDAARERIAGGKTWEALDGLAKAQALAEGTPEAHAIRIFTCETQAKIPNLMRAALQTLEDLGRESPRDVAVHSALGRVFRNAGLSARARAAFRQVLALDPSNREATGALAALDGPVNRR